ncbi:PTS sugar transporter subunit IIA [Vagococcus sp. BWB3-3]|uniref:PTS sugar transporter subunit IIA n=1 Tax=Vagococcus allomyrinae TaxID=2794353 RepID=A0A940SVM8_9ENTE|nr:PTS sugar transporter subunit IIA [Vagococcus allomyrinae]MBP1041231.1 PTS sugar transporter subunit IIA [Vagococcus allomyrinae]
MVKVVIVSHGSFCEGLLETLKMVGGSDFGVKAVPLLPGEAPEDYRDKLANQLDKTHETIILADIAGGTPFQSALYLGKDYRVTLISGMNFPMLLTLALESSLDNGKNVEDLCAHAVDEQTLGIQIQSFEKGEKKQRAKLSVNKNR